MIIASIKKDLRLLLADRGALISMLVLPIVFMAVFGSIFRFGPKHGQVFTVAMVAPSEPRGSAIADAVRQTKVLRLVVVPSGDEARRQVAARKVDAALIVPADSTAEIELCMDPAMAPAAAAGLQGAARAIVTQTLVALAPNVTSDVRTAVAKPLVMTAPPGLAARVTPTGFEVTVPANAVLFGFFMALTVAMAFTEEKRTGTWRRLLASPASRATILLAKLVPYAIASLLQFGFLFAVGIVGFGLRVNGSVLGLLALAMATSVCAVTFGLFLASFAATERQLGSLGSVVTLVMGLLGGCMVPRFVMPSFLQAVGKAVPQAWALDGFGAALLGGPALTHTLWVSGLGLLGFAAAFAAIGVWRFRFES